jgi:glycosyltransferase involved in cell wall biosynthesis
MKIGIFSSFYPPFVIGGAEIVANRQAEELAKRGHNVFVITTNSNGIVKHIEEVNGVKIFRISPINIYQPYEFERKLKILKPIWHAIDLWNPHSYMLIKSILKNEKPDVVHVNNYKGISLAVFSAAKSLGIPLIFTAHDYSLVCPRANLLKESGQICSNPSLICLLYTQIQKKLVKGKIDVVTAPSQFVINKLKARGFFSEARTLVLPNALRFVSENSIAKTIKNYQTISFLYVGQVNKSKGVQVLINAFTRLMQPNIRLHIVGKGQNLEEMKFAASKDTRIIFHGFLNSDDLVTLYKEANVFVLPSIWFEPFGLVIIESQSHSIPVVASNIGGIPELVREGYNGCLFEAGNVDELRNILERLINDPVELTRLGDGAFESSKKFNIEGHITNLEKIYSSLIAQSEANCRVDHG